MKVYVLYYHNGRSDTPDILRAFATQAQIRAWRLNKAVTDWVGDEFGPLPEDEDVLLDTYWDYVAMHEDAWVYWDECEVET